MLFQDSRRKISYCGRARGVSPQLGEVTTSLEEQQILEFKIVMNSLNRYLSLKVMRTNARKMKSIFKSINWKSRNLTLLVGIKKKGARAKSLK